jgi:hypothetical protein
MASYFCPIIGDDNYISFFLEQGESSYVPYYNICPRRATKDGGSDPYQRPIFHN